MFLPIGDSQYDRSYCLFDGFVIVFKFIWKKINYLTQELELQLFSVISMTMNQL